MKYLMWDIDGTLLLTGLAGYGALIRAVKEYYFLDAYDCPKNMAGRTDSSIIKEIITGLRGRCSAGEAASLLIRYHMLLPQELPKHNGRLMKNVEKTLQYFNKPDSRYKNALLTGNTSIGAHEKLKYYKLEQYFDFRHSVFGEVSEQRNELAQVAFSRFYLENQGNFTPDDLIIIGDTPNDAACANAIGARCIIILDGSGSKREDFAEVKPWKIIDALPDDPADFERLLDEK